MPSQAMYRLQTVSRRRLSKKCIFCIMKKVFAGAVLTCLVSTGLSAQTGKILNEFKTPSENPTGLTFDGKHLWQADRGTDKLYCTDPKTGRIIRSIESPAYWPVGLAWDGEYLWNADFRGRTDKSEDRDGIIYKVDPKDGTILRTLTAPSSCPKGLTWDGKYLWLVDDAIDKVIQFNPNDGTTINSFAAPATDPKGIAYDGRYLWISDDGKDEIYMVDPETGFVILIIDAPGRSVHGLAVNGDKLYAADYETDKVYEIKIKDYKTLFATKDHSIHKVDFTHSTTCFGPGEIKTLDVHVAIPENRDNQKLIGDIKYNIPPTDIVTDKWGQKTAHFSFKNVKPGQKVDVVASTTAELCNVRYFLYPENMGSLNDIPQEIKDLYLQDDEKYQINSGIIRSTVRNVVGDEKNPYWIIRKLHQYLIGQLHYVMDGFWDTAPTVLRNGHASCSEYSFAYIALCRAAGVPARYVGSVWDRTGGAYMDDIYHRWIEVYLPGYGWIPTDPTHGDRDLPRDQAFPIGFCRKAALITTQSGGGSETLEWTYNVNAFYTTDPKTNLNTTHYADWNLVK